MALEKARRRTRIGVEGLEARNLCSVGGAVGPASGPHDRAGALLPYIEQDNISRANTAQPAGNTQGIIAILIG